MTKLEKGKRIRDHVEAIERLEKADNMLSDKGYHDTSISIHIHRKTWGGGMEEVILDGECMRDIIHKVIKEMRATNNENLNKLLESKE